MPDLPADPVEDELNMRYVITSAAATQPADLSRLAWEEMTPLEVSVVQIQDRVYDRPSPLDGTQGSFIRADDPALVLSAWKMAEDGDGMILRFQDLGGSRRTAQVELPLFDLTRVQATDSVERNQRELPLEGSHRFQIEVSPNQIITLRLTGKFKPVSEPK